MNDADPVSALIGQQPRGYSLSRALYCDPAVFERDLERVAATQWLLVDHVSRIPNPGDWFLFEIGIESIIVVRDRDGTIHALFNVCRHRGSRVCLEPSGHAQALVCPYHAWSYGLNGELRAARLMPVDFDKSRHGLHRAHVRVFEGFIFVAIGREAPPDFGRAYAGFERFLHPHRFDRARIAAKKHYPTRANWKLVIENFLECYHCAPAHPEYCSVHPPDLLLAYGAGHGSGFEEAERKYAQKFADWEQQVRALGHVTGCIEADRTSPFLQTVERLPVGEGRRCASVDGAPLAPLMGDLKDYDGGETACSFNPLSFVLAACDVAQMFRFTPRGPLDTDVEITWLVHADAEPGRDYDPDKVSWLWDVTTRQDKRIVEDNQRGILSSRYQPGPYSMHEAATRRFIDWYLARVAVGTGVTESSA